MNGAFVMGLCMGMLGALMMNVGKGVQKQYVQVWRQGRAVFAPEHRRDFGLWWLGMLIAGGAVVPYSLGMKLSESPSAISAMNGIGLIGLTIYALKVIGETLGRRETIGMGLVVVGTSVLGYLGNSAQNEFPFSDGEVARAILILLGAGAVGCIASRFWVKLHGVAWGSAAGISIGAALFMAHVALVRAEGSIGGQLSTPYPYIALGLAIGGTITTQIGFLKARALVVVPSVNSLIIITPLLLELIVYRTMPSALRLVFIAVIVAGVFLLGTGAAARIEQ